MKSWQFWAAVRHNLSNGTICGIFKRSSAHIYRWAADPDCTEYARRNPIDRIRIVFERMEELGKGEMCRAMVDYLSEPLGGQFSWRSDAESDKLHPDMEAADSLMALSAVVDHVREALVDGRLDEIEELGLMELVRQAQRELEELVDAATKYGASRDKQTSGS